MGNPIGVVAGIVAVIVIGVVTLVSAGTGISVALLLSYGLFVAAWAYDSSTQPRDFTHVPWLMSSREVSLYIRFHLAIDRTALATFISSALNVLRMFGVVMAGVAFWQGRPWAGAALLVYFVVCGTLAVRLNPYFYVFAGAAEGDERLGEMAHFLARVANLNGPRG